MNPWIDISEENSEITILNNLKKQGVIKFNSKGIGRVNCFEENKIALPEFKKYKSTTNIGSVLAISSKMNKDVLDVMNDLYKWFSEEKLKIKSAPEKVMFYQEDKKLTDDILNIIANDFREKREERLNNFEKLVAIVESGSKPDIAIADFLGIDIE